MHTVSVNRQNIVAHMYPLPELMFHLPIPVIIPANFKLAFNPSICMAHVAMMQLGMPRALDTIVMRSILSPV